MKLDIDSSMHWMVWIILRDIIWNCEFGFGILDCIQQTGGQRAVYICIGLVWFGLRSFMCIF